MKKIIALSLILVCVLSLIGCKWMYDAQYNQKGVSHFLVITIDQSQPKEYVGELEAHSIFVEKLDMDDTYFIRSNYRQSILYGRHFHKGSNRQQFGFD